MNGVILPSHNEKSECVSGASFHLTDSEQKYWQNKSSTLFLIQTTKQIIKFCPSINVQHPFIKWLDNVLATLAPPSGSFTTVTHFSIKVGASAVITK